MRGVVREGERVTRVFVYGTLKEAQSRGSVMCRANLVGRGVAKGKIYEFPGGSFPFAVLGNEGDIQGEVYEVDGRLMNDLDCIEGYPSFYTRDVIEAKLENGSNVKAWIYHMTGKPGVEEMTNRCREVADGNWKPRY